MSTKPGESAPPGAAAPTSAKAELEQRGLQARRALGQNFLADLRLCDKIAALVAPSPANVVEIGAGLGALTAPLLARGNRVLAIETDRNLSLVLREKFEREIATGQLQLLEADAREVDLAALLGTLVTPRTLAGNLPYHLSGLLLRRAVDLAGACERLAFLLQLEVVNRLCAAPDTPDYGALSVFVQSVYRPRRELIVRRGAFYPQPGVDSAVVVLEPRDPPRAPPSEAFARVVKAAFEKRRKTLRNAWRGALGLPPTELELLASAAQIDLAARGETLPVAAFERMAAQLEARRGESP
ncbi:MAG: 16S rRNA (adenine(1518)-N(6)/adenine(1519)-N(6))-dimethyltransferase RsmA [Deltaproteobacteria bacterium]